MPKREKLEEKLLCELFKRLTCDISHEKNVDGAKKRISYERNWISPKAAQNNAIRSNYIKARIDKTQQNSRYKLCDDRNEKINHIISKCSKSSQKEYKTRRDWVGKVIHEELSKKLKFNHTNKWYIHNSKSVHENHTHRFLWDFEVKTGHLIPERRQDLKIINKKSEFAGLWILPSRLTTE